MSRFIQVYCLLGLLLLISNTLKAQNRSGVTGYGKAEVIFVGASNSTDAYIGAGGGVIINDNLMLGGYLRALTKPYKYSAVNLVSDTNFISENPYSKNEFAFNTILNNIESGLSIGFNIAPEKPLQGTLRVLVGYSIVSFDEVYIVEDNSLTNGFKFEESTKTFGGFNAALEGVIQFKLGKAFKLGLLGGYKVSYVNGNSGNIDGVIKNPLLFSGLYGGLELSFGSFQ